MNKGIRYVMAALLAAFIFVLFYFGVDTQKSAGDVFTEMKSTASTGTLTEKTRRELLRYYGINSVDIDSFVLYGASNSLEASELLVIKVQDASQMQTVLEQVEARRASQIESFEAYDAAQAELLRSAVIRTEGPFLLYMAGDGAASWAEAFAKAVR